MLKVSVLAAAAVLAVGSAAVAHADSCGQLQHAGLHTSRLKATLDLVVPGNNGGLNFPMWLTLVDGSGRVCAVVNSLKGNETATANIWLGSRVISAQKANTANSFSTDALSLSTANLFSAVQPGGSLFGLQESNPVNAEIAYEGDADTWGTPDDPLVGKRIGGINVFGGGLTLYIADPTQSHGRRKVGAIGVSGDTSCTDHVVAWKVRSALQTSGILASVPGGVSAAGLDQMIFDIAPNLAGGTGVSAGGFGHATCLNNPVSGKGGNDGGATAPH
jgi:uncharacterized protein GlcG (DUF336 family)